jgi:hypothetical protein
VVHMFDLARDYSVRAMSAYVEKVQELEFAACEARLHVRLTPARSRREVLRGPEDYHSEWRIGRDGPDRVQGRSAVFTLTA